MNSHKYKAQSPEDSNRDWTHLIGYADEFAALSRLVVGGRIPPVILFTGREGIGKAGVIRAVSAMFFCETNTACGTCASCKRIMLDEHPDLLFLSPSSGRLKIEDAILAQEHLSLKTSRKDESSLARRVICMTDVDLMTNQAVNRLLKTLEEPPEDSAILMSTSRKNALLPTLRSRAINWPLSPPKIEHSLELIKTHCQAKGIKLPGDPELLETLRRCGLAPGKVISYFESQSHAKLKEVEDFCALLNGRSLQEVMVVAENLSKRWGWSLPDLIQEAEVQLNLEYRRNFCSQKRPDSSLSQSMLRKRREVLSKMNRLAIKERINLNTQLAAEHLGFYNSL
ncbi:MAG: hypothetical protein HRU09_02620 [Oligoflexales bacterium]|nr:hypothetical protein [Oligoflexales bacterium]